MVTYHFPFWSKGTRGGKYKDTEKYKYTHNIYQQCLLNVLYQLSWTSSNCLDAVEISNTDLVQLGNKKKKKQYLSHTLTVAFKCK